MRAARLPFTLVLLCVVACAGDRSGTRPATPQTQAAALHETANAVKVTILSTMLADQGVGEWGFAALVEHDGEALLFDTGAFPDTVLRNAEQLHIDLTRVTDVS